jgi:hypothetical protein
MSNAQAAVAPPTCDVCGGERGDRHRCPEIRLVEEERCSENGRTYWRVTGGRPLRDVICELNKRLEAEGLLPDEYAFGSGGLRDSAAKFPKKWQFIACFAVTGGSEGHYVHIHVMRPDGEEGRQACISFAKTFRGMEFAQRCAAACARHLGA